MQKIDLRDMPREEWLELRRKYIGGSDIAAIIGLNRYRSPIDVWMDKTGRKEDKPANEAMRQGLDLEDYVAKRFEEESGKKVQRTNFMHVSDDHPYFAANIDRMVVGEDALLECKTTSMYSSGRWKDNKTPDEYYCQVQWYLGVTGREKAYLACIIFNREFLIREIERDDDVISALFKAGTEFWEDYIIKDQIPPPDGSKASGEALREVYSDSDPEGIIELYGFKDRLKRYQYLLEMQKDLEIETERIKQEIQKEMGEAEAGFLGDTRISWKSVAGRSTIDTKRLAADEPDIYEKYMKVGSPYRRFTIDFADTETKGGE